MPQVLAALPPPQRAWGICGIRGVTLKVMRNQFRLAGLTPSFHLIALQPARGVGAHQNNRRAKTPVAARTKRESQDTCSP